MGAFRSSPLPALLALAFLRCAGDAGSPPAPPPPAQEAPKAASFGIWHPTRWDTCTEADHDRYSVVGPDGKRYPTWHPPPTGPGGCTYGHEHGRDPRGSHLYRLVGDMPFGVANEALETWDPANPRREDHFGHKIEWENDVRMRVNAGVASAILEVTCDVMIKLHQGTHSKDAFTNNLHEMVYHIRCNDGSEAHLTFMAAIGTPGEFVRSCDQDQSVKVGPATPANSPNGGGRRIIPDADCVQRFLVNNDGNSSDFGTGLHESWQTSNNITTADGHSLASFDPYFQVNFPSRYYDPSLANITGRPLDLCFLPVARARGGACQESIRNGAVAGTPFDDPRSAFNGVERFVDVNSIRIDNKRGPTVWYTNPFGRGGKTEPFPGSVRQILSKVDNSALRISGPGLGFDRFYGTARTHAPN